ncbi:condensation domain-containing protein, partial [Pectobacterium brasiliense]|uniref:condensation domain-containing protein n=1 Tax=Pectobacterium brasiliense TaxID=180957 RepID=UPI004044A4C9
MRTEISEMWSELSASQRSLWISYQKAPHLRGGYNIAFCPRILGDVDPNLISHTLKLLMAHHPMLRATFRNGDDGPQQRILPLDEAPFFLHDASSWSETALRQHIEAEYRRPFDDDKPLVRAHLYRISARESVLLWVIDHLICDGNTFWILMEEWSALLAQKTLLPLETVSDDPDFFSYVAHQAAWLESPQGKKQFEYWKQTFSGAGATGFDLQLASDSAGSSMPRPRSQSFAVSDEQMGGLSALAAKYGTSLFEVLLASYFIFLRKYTAQNTIMVGSPMPARGQGPWRNTVGNCTHVVPIMAHFDTDLTIGELLTALHATVRQAKRNRHYPFELMIERLPIHRPSAQHAYIQTQFTYQVDRGATGVMKLMVGTVCGPDENRTDATVSWGGWDTVSYPVQISHSDIGNLLNAEIIESVNGLNLVLKYDEQRLSDRTVGRYLTHLSAIIDAIIADADRRVDQISLLSADERRTMLYDWNQIQAEPVSLCLHQQFEAQVRRAPQAVALVCGEQSLSYDALNRHANRLAHALIAQGVGPDMRVAICLPRGVEMGPDMRVAICLPRGVEMVAA